MIRSHMRRRWSTNRLRCLFSSAKEKRVLLQHPKLAYAVHEGDVHCLLGRNGSGKTQLLAELASTSHMNGSVQVQSLGLEAHRAFVRKHGDSIVTNVLGSIGSPEIRDVIVRLGLFPVWESTVKHLSTGEVRKLMLADALLHSKPLTKRVLLMDQPFDGLDLAARQQLEWIISQLTKGFTRLLVDFGGTSRRQTASWATNCQIVLVANRSDQIVPSVLTHVGLKTNQSQAIELLDVNGWKEDQVSAHIQRFLDTEAQGLPQMSMETMDKLIFQLFPDADVQEPDHAIELANVSVSYNQNQRMLLNQVNLQRSRADHWVVIGPNGSGKSSLMRILLQTPDHGLVHGSVHVFGEKLGTTDQSIASISTDQHLQLLDRMEKTPLTVMELLEEHAVSTHHATLAAQLVRLDPSLLHQSFLQLSQGERQLVLIARTLAMAPNILVLDEYTHGLDPFHRIHVLQVMNRIGLHAQHATTRKKWPHLILITHHPDEITSCFTSVFAIQDQQLVETKASLLPRR